MCLIETLEPRRQKQLRAWVTRSLDAEQTQKSLAKLWKVSQPAVSAALKRLEEDGLIVTLPRRGPEATRYALSGVARIAFG